MTNQVLEPLEIGGGTGEEHAARWPHRRKAFGLTLGSLADSLIDGSQTIRVSSNEIEVRQVDSGTPCVRVGDQEYPSTLLGFKALSGRVGVSDSLAETLWDDHPDLGQNLVNELYRRSSDTHAVRVHPVLGVRDIRAASVLYVDPADMMRVAADTIGREAEVSYFNGIGNLRLDVVAPIDRTQFWGGDLAVGDLMGAGLTITQKVTPNQFHAPQIGLYLHRLVCTNGMVITTPEDKLDARGIESAEDWLTEFGRITEEVMARAEHRMRSFYELREQRVANPTQWMRRMAQEQGVSDRVLQQLLGAMIEWLDEDGTASAFDLINLITHFANIPGRNGSDSVRLMQAGGRLLEEHHIRCHSCQARLD